MEQLKESATTDCPFSFWTDIDSQAVFTFTSPSTVRSCLGGMDGSMLDTYGGEFEWDMYTAMLHGHRGVDYGVRIVYGKNLIDFQMERSIENVITGVHPYWKHSEDGTLMELPEKVVTIGEHSLPYEKITPLDCTSEFEEKPTEEQLRSYTNEYLKNTSLTEPDIDIKIDFLQLWQTPGYEDIAASERVSLCDTVHVYISKLGIEVSCKVTETEYDVLLERYTSITLSNASVYSRNSSLSGALGSIRDEANLATEAINRVETQVTDVRTLSVQQEYFNLLAAEAVGLSADALLKGILKTSLVKILGTEHFFWEGDAITISDPSDKKRLMKIGQYVEGNYGIAVSTDGGTNWEAAVNFGGVSSSSSGSSTTIIQGESIVKSETAPVSPAVDSLWIDKSMDPMRLKLWNGSEWKVVGYEPENTEPTEPEEPDNEDATDPDDNAEGGSG